MAVNLDNLDDIINQLASMERAVELDVIREARKRLRATVRKYMPIFKKATPKKSGAAIKSMKVKSSSRRGVSTVTLNWLVSYAGYANFNKGQSAERFASETFFRHKMEMDEQGLKDVKGSFEMMFDQHGVKYK